MGNDTAFTTHPSVEQVLEDQINPCIDLIPLRIPLIIKLVA